MANYQLTPIYPGDGAIHDFEGLCIKEITNHSIVSCAANKNQHGNVSSALESALQLSWPEIGHCTAASQALCLGLQIDQCFVMVENEHPIAKELSSTLKSVAAVTDQSDGWIILDISGSRTRDVLERICPIDLADDKFPIHSLARTSMEHLNVIIVRLDDSFLMLSPRSSAESFLHAVVQSAHYVI